MENLPIISRNIRKFRMEIMEPDTPVESEYFREFFPGFQTPKLKELTIALHLRTSKLLTLESAISNARRYEALETLNIEVDVEGFSSHLFQLIVESFPALRHLSLNGFQSKLLGLNRRIMDRTFQLNTIRLENCDIKNTGFVNAMLDTLKDTNALEKLEVIRCRGVDEAMFKGRVERNKFVWR